MAPPPSPPANSEGQAKAAAKADSDDSFMRILKIGCVVLLCLSTIGIIRRAGGMGREQEGVPLERRRQELLKEVGAITRAEPAPPEEMVRDSKEFITVLPVYYRAISLVVLGIWCWGLDLQVLEHWKIDAAELFKSDPSRRVGPQQVYGIAAAATCILLTSVLLFTTAATSLPSVVLPMGLYTALFVFMLWPGPPFLEPRRVFRSAALHTCCFSWTVSRVGFADVILADILTSYGKVFSDLSGTLCTIVGALTTDLHFSAHELSACRGAVVGAVFAGLPSVLRLFQCLNCYKHERSPHHLANAVKYSSAFPVLVFSLLQGKEDKDNLFFGLWLLSVLVNSLYSFLWDVYRDWGVCLTGLPYDRSPGPETETRKDDPEEQSTKVLRQLRGSATIFPPAIYRICIVLDFLGRFIWSLQLSPHVWTSIASIELDAVRTVAGNREVQMFFFELIEIARRSMWILLRVEWQLVNQRCKGQ